MALSREQKIEKAQKLRDDGLTYREIAERMGCSIPVARRLVNPESLQRKYAYDKAWKDRNREHVRAVDRAYRRTVRATCTSCEGQMGIGSKADGICLECRKDTYHLRCLRIERLWAEGKTFPELMAEFGWNEGRLSVEIHRMRDYGYDLPYRYQHHTSAPRFPEQVAA
jgi:hypothetical protein